MLRAKVASAGSGKFHDAAVACSIGLLAAHERYVCRTREKLKSLRRGSKQWWRLSSQLLGRLPTHTSPGLRQSDGTWVLESAAKANLFADTVSGKWILPAVELNEYTPIGILCETDERGFLPVRAHC